MGEMRFEHSHERVILYDSLEKRGVTDHDGNSYTLFCIVHLKRCLHCLVLLLQICVIHQMRYIQFC